MVTYTIKELDGGATLVEFALSDGVIDTSELGAAVEAAPVVDPTRGVILSGRGPVWLFGALVHHYHGTPFVACFDPRLAGGVVVERHSATAPKLGDIVPV